MPAMTRADCEAIFAHLLDVVLGLNATAPLRMALAQADIINFADFMMMPEEVLRGLEFTPDATAADPNPVSRPVTADHGELLVLLKQWVLTLRHKNWSTMLTVKQWQRQTDDDFETFRLNNNSGPPPVRPPVSPLASSAAPLTAFSKLFFVSGFLLFL